MTFKMLDIQISAGQQFIKIPESLHIEDDRVYVRKLGNALFIIPFHNPWQSLFDSLELFSGDFMDDRAQPEQQKRESFD